jgi:hypothetical protein
MTERRSWTPDQQYEHQRELAQKRAAWDEQRRVQREQEQRDQKRAALEGHLSRRAQDWFDTTGSTPPASVMERWQQQYLDEQELVRQAEREARLAKAEEGYTW